MVLGFKTHFPDKTPTDFVNKILIGEKVHTIREDFNNRWQPGNSIQMATGVRTKKYRQFKEDVCKSRQLIFIRHSFGKIDVFVDSKCLTNEEIDTLIKNDGFKSRKLFIQWFFPNKGQNIGTFYGKIIHWTDLKY